eukprot:10374106-Alexandrium_andersonii.AAC.1
MGLLGNITWLRSTHSRGMRARATTSRAQIAAAPFWSTVGRGATVALCRLLTTAILRSKQWLAWLTRAPLATLVPEGYGKVAGDAG